MGTTWASTRTASTSSATGEPARRDRLAAQRRPRPADPVARDVVEELLTAAVAAPNHHLTGPWRFVVLAGDARREISERLERAPVVVAAVALGSDDPVRAREDRDAIAAAIENLLPAAHARGLGRCGAPARWSTIPRRAAPSGCAPSDAVVGFVYLGHPAGPPPRAPPRPGLDDVVVWRGW